MSINTPRPAPADNSVGNAAVHSESVTSVVAHNNYNYGPGVFNDVRRDQHIHGDQHLRGDQHVQGNQYATTLNFNFHGKSAVSDKEGHRNVGRHRDWEQEPYQTIISILSRVRQHLICCTEHFELAITGPSVCDELDELIPLVRCTARMVEQIGEVFPLMFRSTFISSAQRSAFEWNERLKVLERDVEVFRPYESWAAERTTREWSSLSQRVRTCIGVPRAKMTRFLRIMIASHFFRKLDVQDGGVEELITKHSMACDLHNPKVETIWVRDPTGMKWFSIPLKFCETWNEFSAVIHEYCKDGPEMEYIRRGDWEIVHDADNDIMDEGWFTCIIKLEMRFDVGVIIRFLTTMAAGTCPQCRDGNKKSTIVNGWIRCANMECGFLSHYLSSTAQGA